MNFFSSVILLAISFLSTSITQGGIELDRRYALQSIGFLKASDNVDGLFSDYVSKAYEKFFDEQSRFELRDLTPAVKVLEKSSLSYVSLIKDKKILLQLARTAKVESVIRTWVKKVGESYQFELEWLHAPRMVVLAKHAFTISAPPVNQGIQPAELEARLTGALGKLVAQVPFLGQVTGRDDTWVTVDIGEKSGLRKGDEVIVGSIEEIKQHPLLKKLVDWRIVRTGRLVVDEVEDRISFLKIKEIFEGRQVEKFQKIVKIIPSVVESKEVALQIKKDKVIVDSTDLTIDQPRFGFAVAELHVGQFSRTYTDTSIGRSGGGTYFGMDL